jgi:hypothetical protein
LGVGSYHLDRIRMKLPRTSVEGFERPGRRLYGLRRASRITDINSLLQALEWVPVGAEQSLEEGNLICRHDTPPLPSPNTLSTSFRPTNVGASKGSHPRLGACQSEKQELGLARSLCDSGSITNIIVRPLFKRVEKKRSKLRRWS